MTAATASSCLLNCSANFSRTSLAFPTDSHDERKSGTATLAMKSLVDSSRSSRGYSSSYGSDSSSPVRGSTWITPNRRTHSNEEGARAAPTSLVTTTKASAVSPYLTDSAAISPATSKHSESPSRATVQLTRRWSSMVFWTINWRTMCSGMTCLTHRTTYSASSSASSIGGLERKTRPSAASSGMAYTAAAGSATSFFSSLSAVPMAAISAASPPISVMPSTTASFGSSYSSTTGRFANVSCSEEDMAVGALTYARIDLSSRSKLSGMPWSSTNAAGSPACGSSGTGSSSGSASSGGGTYGNSSMASLRTLTATVARSRVSSSSSSRLRFRSVKTLERRLGQRAANFERAATAAARTHEFSRMTRL
mmetsp:Transcript_16442/g.38123  ORF Transcript_16442/g.38123 Transcript_16442/m.38123 type:complete len:366 (+) Transcript_16442:370-1467(+)